MWVTQSEAFQETFGVILALLLPAIWAIFTLAYSGVQLGWPVIVGVLLITFGMLVLLKLLQVRRPYRFTRRTAMHRIDAMVDRSVFGAGSQRGWTATNPAASLADLLGPQISEPSTGFRGVQASALREGQTRSTGSFVAYTVRRGDSFWSLAEELLGNGQRWAELQSANVGREVEPGVALQEGDLLMPGWVIAVPELEASA